MVMGQTSGYVSIRDDLSSLARELPRANPSRGGDAKPGTSNARPPGCRFEGVSRYGGVERDSATDTHLLGIGDPGVDGPVLVRRHAVVVAMHTSVLAHQPLSRTNGSQSPLELVIRAGHRWA